MKKLKKIDYTTSHLNFHSHQINEEIHFDSLTIIAERILFLAHLDFESNLIKNRKLNVKGEVTIEQYKKYFSSKKSNIIPQVKKTLEELLKFNLIVKIAKSQKKAGKITVFKKLDYVNGSIFYTFSEKYITYRMLGFNKDHSIESIKEIRKINSKHTFNLLRFFKTTTKLDQKGNTIIIKLSDLRKILLGYKNREMYAEKGLFNQKALNIALSEINSASYIRAKLTWQRPIVIRNGQEFTLKSGNHVLQGEQIKDYEYYFKVSSYRKTLINLDQFAFANMDVMEDITRKFKHQIKNQQVIKKEKKVKENPDGVNWI